MKLFLLIIISFFLFNCSFDKKTGIWTDENNDINNVKNDTLKEFKKISTSSNIYNKKIFLKQNSIFNISKPVSNLHWNDIFYQNNNNLTNFEYSNINQIIFKSKKLTKNSINKYKLYHDGKVIISDLEGNINVFSVTENKVVAKFNFYKKRFKRIEKKINLIVEKDIIFVSDNLGYIYSYDYINQKIVWAKNYKVPFSSNLKIFKNNIIASDQNNHLYIINKKNGDLIKLIPTEETVIKNQFINSLSVDNRGNLFFLNSFGSLYSIDINTLNINWFYNFNKSFDLSPSNLFIGNQIINNDKYVIMSSNNDTFIIEVNTGSIIKKFNFSSLIRPIIINNVVFFITNNNFLIAINLETKNILYSLNITEIKNLKIKNFTNNIVKNIMILDSSIFVFLKNSKVLIFDIYGEFKKIIKLQSNMQSYPISIDGSILYLNDKNKLIVLN